ncbi:MAG: hypothetical protein DWQ07_16795 [Chloroflexi bacterium]|nr:MAG: hypothetical protein DWQ07_16795 [Chloroflexota bacterium]MBL1195406.1 hypothetical protein [Chloroflexota bacterium]NOH12689.1 hypothetical protein [Chloroflexota bacterium]
MKRFLLLVVVFLLAACGSRAEVGENFDLSVGELATVADADILIRVDSIGRDFTEGGEIPFVVLMVEVDGEEHSSELSVAEDLDLGNYTVEVQSIDPFADPPECSLRVSAQ